MRKNRELILVESLPGAEEKWVTDNAVDLIDFLTEDRMQGKNDLPTRNKSANNGMNEGLAENHKSGKWNLPSLVVDAVKKNTKPIPFLFLIKLLLFIKSRKQVLAAFVSITLFVLVTSSVFSQEVSATVDRDKILIGEQVELLVTISGIDPNSLDINKWFNLPDSFNHLEVVKRLPVDTSVTGGLYSYSQKIILTSFDSGYWEIPAINILLTNKKSVTTEPVDITVLPVDVSNLKDYHDIKEILEVKAETDWWVVAEIALGVLVLLILLVVLIRYLKKRKPRLKSEIKKSGIEEVLRQIEALQHRGLIAQQQHKLYFTELVHICRSFSDRQLVISSANKTTDEYMVLLKGKIGTEPTQLAYFQLLRLADAVKFAKFIPGDRECEEAAATAKTFVSTIYQFQKTN